MAGIAVRVWDLSVPRMGRVRPQGRSYDVAKAGLAVEFSGDGRCIHPALDQADEVHRTANHFRKLRLREPSGRAEFRYAPTGFF